MADASVGLNATDLFGLGGNFNPQTSSTRTVLQRAMMLDASGNQQCETMIDQMDEVSVSYAYCNSSPNIASDLSDFLTEFGNVQNGYIITQLAINFTAGQYATVDVTGHQHGANTHVAGLPIGYADVSGAVPASAGFGVPLMPGAVLGDDATPISTTLTFTMNHIDALAADGTHFVGKNITPTAEASVTYQGTPTTAQPFTGWTSDSYGGDDGNEEFDSYEVAAHRYFDLATA